ncbi:MAG TPA: carbamoyltransferase C-terminal domain-containing protein [Thermoanaerobaculia bacterium]|nr:carbamoyltransferase C-terminal domain-containing protein [Thermoanaerobaculia bacterium]
MKDSKAVLGVHIGHDRGAAVVADGRLVGALAQERVDRRKHSPSPELPYHAIETLLRYLRLPMERVAAVSVSYTNVTIDKVLPQLAAEFRDHYSCDVPVLGVSHHAAHALAAFYTSPFTESLVLVADGSGDIVGDRLEAESLFTADDAGVRLVGQRLQAFPMTHSTRRNFFNYAYLHDMDASKQVSLGRKYEQLTYLLGFAHGEAGKTMGLASYGQPLVQPHVPVDGLQFSLTIGDVLREIEEARVASGLAHHRFVRERRADIAATAQAVVEQVVIDLLNAVNRDGAYENLSLAGGLFLNCLLNHRIVERTRFRRVHVIPAAGDDGQAIGAAFHAYDATFGKPAIGAGTTPFLGPSYDRVEVRRRLRHFKLAFAELPENVLIARIVEALTEGKVVGLFRGRSESGPRALCHRSILADPRSRRMRDRLNRHVKYREEFRPFGPVVTAEDQFRYFDLLQSSPHMLLAAQVKNRYRRALGAVTHVDGTARVQAITAEEEPFVHALLRAYADVRGHPVLLNTSFNLADEPIVESPHDAIATFLRSNIDVLVLEHCLVIDKHSHD